MLRINKRIQQTFWTLLGACVVGYFIYHTIQGDRGWFAMIRTQNEVKAAQDTLAKLQQERQELRHRTQLLTNGIDPDLLEEKSRELLNYSKPNEIVVLTPPQAPRPKEGAAGKNGE